VCQVVEDIIQALSGRNFMYREVYWHKTVSAACMLIQEAIESACLPLQLVEKTRDLEQFMHITDDFLMGTILSSKEESLKESKVLMKRLLLRDIPKLAYKCTIPKELVEQYVNVNNTSFETAFKRLVLYRFCNLCRIKCDCVNYCSCLEKLVRVDSSKLMSTIDVEEFDKNNAYVKTKSGTIKTAKSYLNDSEYLRQYCTLDQVLLGRVYVDSPHNVKW
jgi:HD superfamily phosphohydrolase